MCEIFVACVTSPVLQRSNPLHKKPQILTHPPRPTLHFHCPHRHTQHPYRPQKQQLCLLLRQHHKKTVRASAPVHREECVENTPDAEL
jgi:hypothetical protein